MCNRAVTGRLSEFTRREESSGFIVTYSFVRIHERYHSCYGVTLGLGARPRLVTPFMAGSRFDNNRTIDRLFLQDFGLQRGDEDFPPSGVWSSGEWRNNTLDLLEERLAAPETHLLPRYLAAFRSAKERLLKFLELGADLCNRFDGSPLSYAEDSRAILRERAAEFGCDPAVIDFMAHVQPADALRIGGAIPCSVSGSSGSFDLTHLDLRSIALSCLPNFLEHRAELAEFQRTLERL